MFSLIRWLVKIALIVALKIIESLVRNCVILIFYIKRGMEDAGNAGGGAGKENACAAY